LSKGSGVGRDLGGSVLSASSLFVVCKWCARPRGRAMHTLAKAGELSLKLPAHAKTEPLGRKKSRSALAPSPAPTAGDGASSSGYPSRVPSRALAVVARSDPETQAYIAKFTRKHCTGHVSEEWKRVDDKKLDKLRGILAALQEEEQQHQLLKRESEDRQAGRALQATREDVRQRVEECRAQERLFEEQAADFKRHVLENERSLRHMETNIEKGQKKVREEEAEIQRLDCAIKAVQAHISQNEEDKTYEEGQIARAAEHKTYLEQVVQEEEDFEGDIKVLMNRYDRLESEKQSLHQKNTALASKLNQVREELLKVQAAQQTEQMMSSSRLHESQVTLEKQIAESSDLEQVLNRKIEVREVNKSRVGVILMAIEQIFTRAVQSCRLKQRREAMLAEVDANQGREKVALEAKDSKLEPMLNAIIARVKDLRDMSEKVRKELDEQKQAAQGLAMDDDDRMPVVEIVQSRRHQEEDGPRQGHGESRSRAVTGTGKSGGNSGPCIPESVREALAREDSAEAR